VKDENPRVKIYTCLHREYPTISLLKLRITRLLALLLLVLLPLQHLPPHRPLWHRSLHRHRHRQLPPLLRLSKTSSRFVSNSYLSKRLLTLVIDRPATSSTAATAARRRWSPYRCCRRRVDRRCRCLCIARLTRDGRNPPTRTGKPCSSPTCNSDARSEQPAACKRFERQPRDSIAAPRCWRWRRHGLRG